jgi:hypothetical protein
MRGEEKSGRYESVTKGRFQYWVHWTSSEPAWKSSTPSSRELQLHLKEGVAVIFERGRRDRLMRYKPQHVEQVIATREIRYLQLQVEVHCFQPYFQECMSLMRTYPDSSLSYILSKRISDSLKSLQVIAEQTTGFHINDISDSSSSLINLTTSKVLSRSDSV